MIIGRDHSLSMSELKLLKNKIFLSYNIFCIKLELL